MIRTWIGAGALVVALATGTAQHTARADGGRDGAAEAIAAVNALRAEAGLGPVVAERRLACAAMAHARDLAGRETLDHVGADGADLALRLVRAGYRFARAAENLARAGGDAREVVGLWRDSPGHRRNMLDPAVREAAAAQALAGNGVYWVLVLAAPAAESRGNPGKRRISGNCGSNPG